MATKKRPGSTPSIEEFLAPFPPTIQATVQQLRTVMRELIPEVREAVYPGWKLIGYRVKQDGVDVYLGYVAPASTVVHLGFELGILIPDPDKQLSGSGSQVRYLTFTSPDEIKKNSLEFLLKDALAVTLYARRKNKSRRPIPQ